MDLYEKQNTPLIALCPLNKTATINVLFNDTVCWTVARKAFGISGGHPNGLRDPSDAHQIKQIKHPSTIKIWTIWVASNKGITEHGRICSAWRKQELTFSRFHFSTLFLNFHHYSFLPSFLEYVVHCFCDKIKHQEGGRRRAFRPTTTNNASSTKPQVANVFTICFRGGGSNLGTRNVQKWQPLWSTLDQNLVHPGPLKFPDPFLKPQHWGTDGPCEERKQTEVWSMPERQYHPQAL